MGFGEWKRHVEGERLLAVHLGAIDHLALLERALCPIELALQAGECVEARVFVGDDDLQRRVHVDTVAILADLCGAAKAGGP